MHKTPRRALSASGKSSTQKSSPINRYRIHNLKIGQISVLGCSHHLFLS
nr:MAG TPA: hypothetical protein [Siphoviridae sp. ctcOR4]